jgi:hypothetical protein
LNRKYQCRAYGGEELQSHRDALSRGPVGWPR